MRGLFIRVDVIQEAAKSAADPRPLFSILYLLHRRQQNIYILCVNVQYRARGNARAYILSCLSENRYCLRFYMAAKNNSTAFIVPVLCSHFSTNSVLISVFIIIPPGLSLLLVANKTAKTHHQRLLSFSLSLPCI